jgi:hypothetical protein
MLDNEIASQYLNLKHPKMIHLPNEFSMRTKSYSVKLLSASIATLAAIGASNARAGDTEVSLNIHDHRFQPTELVVPANKRVRLTISNEDNSAEEFESYSLNREKIIPGTGKVVVFIGPLKPGRYEFFGEYNQATAKGAVVAK